MSNKDDIIEALDPLVDFIKENPVKAGLLILLLLAWEISAMIENLVGMV